MKDYSSVFKAYDLRSLYNDPMDTTFVYSLGKAIGKHVVKEYGSDADFLLGCDGRTGNPELLRSFIGGLQDGGCDNWAICNTAVAGLDDQEHPYGVCSTAFFYRCMYKTFHLGAIFTASHNPAGWVGMKNANSSASLLPSHELQAMITEYEPCPYTDDEGYIQAIDTVIQQALLNPDERITQKRVEYMELLAGLYDDLDVSTIVVDYSGGACTGYEYAFFQILQEQGWNIVHLNEKTDNLFSAHPSDTNQPVNYTQLGDAVRKHKALFGIMFDGDGDRLGMVDELGTFVSGDILLPIIAQAKLKEQPGAHIVYDITCSNNVPEGVMQAGGTTSSSKVGYRNVKKEMKNTNAVFGGELSGHLLFPEAGYAENPLIALGYIMQTLQGYDSFSTMVAAYTKWIKKPVTNYHVENKVGVISAIKQQYSAFPQNELDGVRIDGEDRWFLVRASNTEPKLRTYIEAMSQEKIDDITDVLESIIGSKPVG